MPLPLQRAALAAVMLAIVPSLGPQAGAAGVGAHARAARSAGAPRRPSPSFEVQEVAPNVYAVLRREPPGYLFQSNSVFIVCDSDVVVVDAQFTAAATREVLGALRRITSKPVRYVVNTHSHDDHVTGNQVYRDAFPGVEFIGHEETRADLETGAAERRRQLVAALPEGLAAIRERLRTGTTSAGAALTDEQRASLTSDLALGERYLAEAPSFRLTPPTITFADHLTLVHGGRTIELRYLGRAHTAGDIVVRLPADNVVITGDLIVWPVPLVGSTSHPADYVMALERLRALRPAAMVPGHGPVMRDDGYLDLMIRMLTSLTRQVDSAVARGETVEQAQKSVNLDEYRAAFAGDSKVKQGLFTNYVLLPGVVCAHREASARRS